MNDIVQIKPNDTKPTEQKKTNFLENEDLLTEVIDLRLTQGKTYREIGEIQHRPHTTVYNHFKRYVARYAKATKPEQEARLGEYVVKADYVWQQTILAYEQSKNELGKKDINILHRGMGVMSECFKNMQSAGLMPKVSEKLEIDNKESITVWLSKFYTRRVIPDDKATIEGELPKKEGELCP